MITHLFKDSTTGQLHGILNMGPKQEARGSDGPRGAHSPTPSCSPGAQTERGVFACLGSQQNRKTVLTKDTFLGENQTLKLAAKSYQGKIIPNPLYELKNFF